MYNKIYDPEKLKYVTLDNINGVNILMKYLDFLKGGRNKFPNPPKSPAYMKKISPPKSIYIHKKNSPKKTSPKKTSPKKTSPNKISPKKTSPKKTSPKKTSPKKTSPKKTSPNKTSPNKTSPKKTSPKKTSPKKTSPKKTSPKKTSPKKTSPKKGTLSNTDIKAVQRRKYILGKRISPVKGTYDNTDLSGEMTRLYRTLISYRDDPGPIIGRKKTTTRYLKKIISGESDKMKATIKEYFKELDRYTIQYGIAVNNMRTQRKQNITVPPLEKVNNTFDKIFDSLLKDYSDSLTKIYWINLIFKYQDKTPSTKFIVKNAISISKGFRDSLVKLDSFKKVRGNMIPHLLRLDFALDELPNFRRLNYLEFGKV